MGTPSPAVVLASGAVPQLDSGFQYFTGVGGGFVDHFEEELFTQGDLGRCIRLYIRRGSFCIMCWKESPTHVKLHN
jgi:hypothetical protein